MVQFHSVSAPNLKDSLPSCGNRLHPYPTHPPLDLTNQDLTVVHFCFTTGAIYF